MAARTTPCDLNDVTALCMPWTEIDGQLRPDFSRAAAIRSLELAATAYDLKIEEWREAGWHDISYQVDNTLLTGAPINGGAGGGLSGAVSDYFRLLARSRITRQNPISQLRGALRQREGSDTCKAIVMIHRAPGGRYVVAIGFMGTGKRIYDWFSNFRLTHEEGMHMGFLQLAREFEENFEKISFPETARELGLDRLTLKDILDECRRPGSRFRIWMAGHSQGGAVMQLVAFRAIRRGFLRQNLIGYGFASPSVVYENPGCDLSGFPLYHIINGDDVTPRVGAALHVGRCRVMTPDEAMRETCYRAAWPDPVFRALLRSLSTIRDSRSGLIWTLALLHALEDVPQSESVTVINGVLGRIMPEKLLGALGGRLDELIRFLIRKTQRQYTLSTGETEMPDKEIFLLRLRIGRLIAQYGARPFVKALLQSLALPHKLRGNDPNNGIAAYTYIVTERFDELRQKVWCGSVPRMGETLPAPRRLPVRALPAGRYARLSRSRRCRGSR